MLGIIPAIIASGQSSGVSPFSGHATLANNINGYWKFDVDGTFSDSSGVWSDAIITGATYTATGKIAGGYSFDGVNDDIYIDNFTGFDGDFSISYWYRGATDALAYYHALSMKEEPTAQFTCLRDNNAGALQPYFRSANGSAIALTTSASSKDYIWRFIVLTWDNTTKTLTAYVNGVYDTNGVNAGMDASPTNSKFSFGERNNLAYWYKGLLDEVGLWSRKLTSDEISDLYNSGNGLTY